jgi:hypothetical protein
MAMAARVDQATADAHVRFPHPLARFPFEDDAPIRAAFV